MAVYTGLYNLRNNKLLRQRVEVAIRKFIEITYSENKTLDFHNQRIKWSKETVKNIEPVVDQLIWCVITNNVNLHEDDIVNMPDSQLQNIINSAIRHRVNRA